MSGSQDFLSEVNKFRSGIDRDVLSVSRKKSNQRQLFVILITRISDETKVQFTSLFARLSYLITTYQIPYKESYILHYFRKHNAEITRDLALDLGNLANAILVKYCLDQNEKFEAIDSIFKKIHKDKDFYRHSFVRELKVQLKTISIGDKKIEAQCVDEPFDQLFISYNRPDRNEDYTELFEKVDSLGLCPLTCNLIDVEIDKAGVMFPGSIVFEPDFMYDVTAISECFGAFANHEAGYLLRKFLKKAVSKPILIGNLSNYFLDQLIFQPHAQFSDFVQQIFTNDPLAIALLSDQEVREMLVLLESHFDHIKKVVTTSFKKINVAKNNAQIEPSFYSAKYGIQGRLDLFSINKEIANIIELKSGNTFRPNSYGLSNNHYHQTLIYDLLIESVYGSKLKRNNFILYSKENQKQLRFAPTLKVEQREAIKERNHLYIHDRILQSETSFIDYYRDYANKHANHIKGFQRTDYDAFLKATTNLEKIEELYCNRLFQFTMRELFLGKLGSEGSDRSRGLASLWTQNIEEKKDLFNIINHLKIKRNASNENEPLLELIPSKETTQLSNFRVGDLGILYPFQDKRDDILHHQVFKVTVLSLEENSIRLRLRSRQENRTIFDKFEFWHIEHDSLDNGYYNMSRSIYEFIQASSRFRNLLMGRRPPELYPIKAIDSGHHLTEEQSSIFSEIVNSKEYYLLWGPPGTGKTSVMLREIAHHYIVHEHDRILLLAYTNRAVDEICAALESLDPIPNFIRIGSRYSTHPRFQSYLLEDQILGITNRKALKEKLSSNKVYVGTLASITGKVNLFSLVKFDLAVIDEASQILESSLIGILGRVRKFVLIGDHLQLPAVVLQNNDQTVIRDERLVELEITNVATSLFERMYKRAVSAGWNYAVGQLTHQGRMHIDIMDFVNKYFYKNRLKHLDKIDRLGNLSFYEFDQVKMNRLVYFNTAVDLKSDSIKVNEHEADQVVIVCKQILEKCDFNKIEIENDTIGIITPYRAQISSIKRKLRIIDPKIFEKITIDTVERYQGGARDIIIMSACMNYSFQLDSLVSPSEDGVDRKLNVAITRAREQFVLIGNQAVLSQNGVYRLLIQSCASTL